MELEVRHLRYIDAVGTAGSVTQAAVALGLSQPSLTAQLRRIEQVLGSPVFDRGRYGARPTTLGRVLLPHAREVLAALDDLTKAVRGAADGPRTPTLRLGTRSTVLASRFCEVVGEVFGDRLIDLTVLDRRASCLSALSSGLVDLVLHVDFPGRETVPPPGTRVTVVGTEPIFVLLPESHPAAARSEVDLRELAGVTWLLWASGDDEMNRHLIAECDRAGAGAVTVREFDHLVAAQLIRRGDPVAFPLQALSSGVTLPGVVRPLRDNPLRVRHVLLWPTTGVVAGHVDQVRDKLIDTYRSMIPDHGRIPPWWSTNPGWLGS
ncbi:LysR family transcriptional regulator [Actinokineospora globicatena]|uniref:LysR family transcriptional regulator n=1 Tax=Actinokineospora globicatena TaxID=103729 RepID=UPI0020A2CF7A|nr:LysR family transcriptional regulator [Actinokineospora globicatena]MCP2302707.1 DNA-binding transcriptional regulator, LysR family [Actinokineospora globicatena]GLW75605.1 LysR family transcriptional regulator [Actinokineospora globicatena]GLW82445.1 LysR family transcriptional regulator [Actinokineospora globicatena]